MYGNSNFIAVCCFLSKTLLSSVDGCLLSLWTRNQEVPAYLFVSSRLDDEDEDEDVFPFSSSMMSSLSVAC